MDKNEFIAQMVGVPWVNRAANFDQVDCWGLVIMYYRHVKGIELPAVDGYCQNIDISECWQGESSKGRWITVNDAVDDGLVFTCFKGEKPTHVGITIGDGKVMHANGHNKSGGVQVNTIKALESLYGKMSYHKFIG